MFQEIAPSLGKGSRSQGVGVMVDGTKLKFNKETVNVLGLKDHVTFGTDPGSPGKLYIYTGGTQKINLNGLKQKNGSVYTSDISPIKAACLVSGEFYPLGKDEKGQYISYDPTATWKESTKSNGAAKATKPAPAKSKA